MYRNRCNSLMRLQRSFRSPLANYAKPIVRLLAARWSLGVRNAQTRNFVLLRRTAARICDIDFNRNADIEAVQLRTAV